MSNTFSAHEFFIREGDAFTVSVVSHSYFERGDVMGDGKDNDPRVDHENVRLEISSGGEWEIQVSIPKGVLKQLVRIAQRYLKDGKEDAFISTPAQ